MKENSDVLGSYVAEGLTAVSMLVFWSAHAALLVFLPLPPPRPPFQEVLIALPVHMLPFAFLAQDHPASLAAGH